MVFSYGSPSKLLHWLKILGSEEEEDQSSMRSRLRLLQLLESQTGAFKRSLLINRKKKPTKIGI